MLLNIEAQTKWYHLINNILNYNFLRDIFDILIQISLEFVHESFIDNKSSLIQEMAWLTSDYLDQLDKSDNNIPLAEETLNQKLASPME